MKGLLFSLPFVAAGLGWLLAVLAMRLLFHPLHPRKFMGFTRQGIIPKRQAEFAGKLGQLAASFLSIQEIGEKIAHPDNVKKIMPQAEAHIDNFLRVKLVKSMPVVGMFVGNTTINNLKALFVAELEALFPEIMTNYIANLREDFKIEQTVSNKIAGYPPEAMEQAFVQLMKKELAGFKIAGALFGFLLGLLQLGVLALLVH